MSTNVNLASGQFITSINGKRCTAVPKAGGGGGGGSAATTTANNNNNGGNVQATPNAVQAASSSTTDSTTTTSTLVKSTSTSTTSTSTSTSTSTTSTSTIISTSTQEANAGLAPAVQETTADSPPDTTSPALPTNQNIPVASSPQPQAQAQTTPVSIQASQADTGVIATLATASATTGTSGTAAGAAAAASSAGSAAAAASAATGAPQSITNGNGAAIFSTIAAPPGATDDGSSTAAAAAAGDGNNPALSAVTSTPGTNPETTIAIAGGVIGGVAFLSLVAFLVWFWRRRMRKRRRSTLLTPLSVDPATFGGRGGGGDGTMRNGEKGEYVINRGSIGPTPKSEKIKATFDYNIRRIKGRFGDMMASRASNGSVNMDRGNSQFMGSSASDVGGSRDSNTMNNVAAANASNGGYGAVAKDRVAGWFGRVADASAGLTSKFRGGSNGDADSQDEKRAMGAQSNGGKEGQPDFLTLLGMDERELERAAQNKKNSKKKRASMDRGRYGSSSNNDYLGRLNIDFDDPFSDTNAIAHQSAKPAPLTVSQANNPFSDANAISSNAKPNTYVADIRRSRGQNDPNFQSEGMYRDSIQTVATVDTSAKRNRFRSDPFDLERPELLQLGRSTSKTVTSSNMSVAGSSNAPSRLSGGVGTGDIRRPRAAHQRGDSFTSKYSSGVSMGDWSDPGPDVGPSAPMWGDSSSDRRRDSPTKGRTRSNSDESSNSVGKAL